MAKRERMTSNKFILLSHYKLRGGHLCASDELYFKKVPIAEVQGALIGLAATSENLIMSAELQSSRLRASYHMSLHGDHVFLQRDSIGLPHGTQVRHEGSE